MTVVNQPTNMNTTSAKPGSMAQAGSQWLSRAMAPNNSVKNAIEPIIGHLLSCGT